MTLQENIQRIKEMMNLNEKLEDIKGIPLYHKTSTIRGLNIINSDSLRGSLPSEEYLDLDKRLSNTKTQTAISLTRDKNWTPDFSIGVGLNGRLEDNNMIFVLDKSKLQTKYKIEPFNYEGLDSESKYLSKNPEYEERVMTNKIHPLRKYLIDIIYQGNDPKVQEIINDYLNG